MRLALLTTETPHHVHFLREVAAAYPVELVLCETGGLAPPYPVHHLFESERDAHERDLFFAGGDGRLADYAPTTFTGSVNDPEAVAALAGLAPDVVLVFGTGRVGPEAIALCPRGMLNLHGGDPEHYRGLDTHLWAVWHRDFQELVTTIHRVNPVLDDGEIVLQEALELRRSMGLHELRALNTMACVRLALAALDMLARYGKVASRPQRRIGRSYSFMPACLKDACVSRFAAHTAALP